MATLTADGMADLIKSTLKDLGRMKMTQIATRLQKYEVMGRLLKKDKVAFDSGRGIQKNIMTDHSSAAKNVGLYEKDTINVVDFLQNVTAPWRQTTVNWAYEHRETLYNRGAAKILDLIKSRRMAAMISLAEVMEAKFWNCPTDANDTLEQFGVYYWVTKHTTGTSTTTDGDFNGGNNLIFTSGPGGLSASTYTRWKNFTSKYTNVTKADLIKRMRKAHEYCQWESPVDFADYRTGRGDEMRIYCQYDTLSDMEDLGEKQNENLGRDLASMDGSLVFRGHPIRWVPKLNDDADKPVFMLRLADFYPVFLRGDYLRETGPIRASEQHNVWVTHVDTSWNFMCTNRRTQAVISQGLTYPTSLYTT